MKFRNEYDFLSNMYSCRVHDDYGIEYSSVEAAYQASKTDDLGQRRKMSRMSGPEAKKFGRKLDLVCDWEQKKVDVMRRLLAEKFSDPELMARLKAIDGEIVEENSWNDKFWGVYKGRGENMLGKLLMEVRSTVFIPYPTEEDGAVNNKPEPGHIVITNVGNVQKAIDDNQVSDVWFVVRSLKSLGGSLPNVKNAKAFWVEQLSPSPGLFSTYWNLKQQGNWNHDAFMSVYVPQFLDEMKTDFAKNYLNILYSEVVTKGKNIALVCFCQDEAECHRSILAGLMQGVGVKVLSDDLKEVDYRKYYDMYKGVSQPAPEQQQTVNPEPVQEVDTVPQQQEEQTVTNPEFYLLVAGSRTFHDAMTMEGVLNHMLSVKAQTHKIVIVEGGARGADTLAREYAINHGYEFKEFPARWVVNGQKDKAAGFKRNRVMHEFLSQQAERGCVCFWDGKSKGTADNFKLCEEFDTPLRIFDFELFKYVH